MRKALIDSYLPTLISVLGPVRPSFDDPSLDEQFAKRDLFKMAGIIKRVLHIETRVFLDITDGDGAHGAPAWITRPDPMPLWGTEELRQARVIIHMNRAFIAKACFEMIVAAFAHEFSLVVLDATKSSLRNQEEAVDLTAMLLGFRDFYVTGCSTFFSTGAQLQEYHVSYLSNEEIWYAAQAMTFR